MFVLSYFVTKESVFVITLIINKNTLRSILIWVTETNFTEFCIQVYKLEGQLAGEVELEVEVEEEEEELELEGPESEYNCTVCGRILSSSGNLKRHEDQHKGIYPYHCKHCNAGYTNPDRRRKHMRKCVPV